MNMIKYRVALDKKFDDFARNNYDAIFERDVFEDFHNNILDKEYIDFLYGTPDSKKIFSSQVEEVEQVSDLFNAGSSKSAISSFLPIPEVEMSLADMALA